MEKFTPGPWEFDTYNHINAKGVGRFAPERVTICSIPDYPDIDGDGGYEPEQSEERGWWYSESASNAHLISAAPDMFEALKVMTINGCNRHTLGMAEAALKKARGGI